MARIAAKLSEHVRDQQHATQLLHERLALEDLVKTGKLREEEADEIILEKVLEEKARQAQEEAVKKVHEEDIETEKHMAETTAAFTKKPEEPNYNPYKGTLPGALARTSSDGGVVNCKVR